MRAACRQVGVCKTTITKCINGLVPSFEPGIRMEGRVRVCGLDPSACEMYELAKHVGSVFQNPKSQFFNLTSNDELAFGLETQGVAADEIERRVRERCRRWSQTAYRPRREHHERRREAEPCLCLHRRIEARRLRA